MGQGHRARFAVQPPRDDDHGNAGHGAGCGPRLLKTSADATGTSVIGTLNNCSGGLTPWGTFVSCEENFHQYFANRALLNEDDPTAGHAWPRGHARRALGPAVGALPRASTSPRSRTRRSASAGPSRSTRTTRPRRRRSGRPWAASSTRRSTWWSPRGAKSSSTPATTSASSTSTSSSAPMPTTQRPGREHGSAR